MKQIKKADGFKSIYEETVAIDELFLSLPMSQAIDLWSEHLIAKGLPPSEAEIFFMRDDVDDDKWQYRFFVR